MPNTLAHLAVQGLATRALLPRSDLKWIALGCVLPDLPFVRAGLVETDQLRSVLAGVSGDGRSDSERIGISKALSESGTLLERGEILGLQG